MRALRLPPLLFALVFAAGCGQEPSAGKAPPGKDAAPRPPGKPRPDVRMTSIAFAESYAADRAEAFLQYEGKWLELTGLITGMGRTINKRPQLTLQGVPGTLLGVMCFMRDPEPWKTYTPGQEVKVVGRFTAQSGAAALVDCVVAEAGKIAVPSVTAAVLAHEYIDDRNAAVRKYDEKHLIVTGEVVQKETNDAGAVQLDLKGEGTTNIRCTFTSSEKEVADAVKVGQKVSVLGEFTLNLAPGQVKLYSCFLRTPPADDGPDPRS
jgi:hypothetical protein